MSSYLRSHGLYSPWNSPGQNIGAGSLSLPQGIFSTQGLNPGLLHYRQILYQLSQQGSPRILEWVAFSFSSGSSQPRDGTQVSRIAGGFFTSWATREALFCERDGNKLSFGSLRWSAQNFRYSRQAWCTKTVLVSHVMHLYHSLCLPAPQLLDLLHLSMLNNSKYLCCN